MTPTTPAAPPMQPIYVDGDGIVRFRRNAIVDYLHDTKVFNPNSISAILSRFPIEDVEQFWQMLGPSVSGYGDLSFIRKETIKAADLAAEKLRKEGE